MIFCRYESAGKTRAGIIRGNAIHRLRGGDSLISAIAGHWEEENEKPEPLTSVRLRAPLPDARNIFCVAANYPAHIRESGGEPPEKTRTNPRCFLKPRGAVRGPDDPIAIPFISPDAIDWECELAVVIGRAGRHIPVSEAANYLGGFTVFNDFSDRHFRPLADREEGPWDKFFDWLHGKWHEGFAALGPVIVTPASLPKGGGDLTVQLRVNGVLRQNASTRDMIFSPPELISFISQLVTLEPGDVIATGTPSGVAAGLKCPYLRPGDVVEAEIEGIGILRNRMVAEDTIPAAS